MKRPVHADAAALLAQVAARLTPPGAWNRDARGPGGTSWSLTGALFRVFVEGPNRDGIRYSYDVFGDAVYLLALVLRARGECDENGYVMPCLKRFNDQAADLEQVLALIAAAGKVAEI